MKSKTLTKFFEINETYCSSFFHETKKTDSLLTFLTWNVISFSPKDEPVDLITPELCSCRRRSPSDIL